MTEGSVGVAGSRPQFAVLGSPIAHSKSPALHAAAYRALGFDALYTAVDVPSGSLANFIGGLDDSWRGLSLTMPLKEEVLALLSGADRVARLTAAANTVLFTPNVAAAGAPDAAPQLLGFNTDVAGIVRALQHAGVSAVPSVLVLGAGATARSAVVAAAELGAQSVTVAARSVQRAESIRSLASEVGLRFDAAELGQTLEAGIDAGLTISTLPGGALEAADVEGLRVPDPASAGAALLDVAYHPWPSALAEVWLRGGGTVVSGLAMLVNQALLQVRIFVGGDPEVALENEAAVRAAMFAAVDLAEPGA